MLIEGFKDSWLGCSEWVELFAERKKELLILLEQGEVEKLWKSEDQGTGIRLRNNERFNYFYTTSLKGKDIERLIPPIEKGVAPQNFLTPASSYVYSIKIPFKEKSIGEKLDLLLRADNEIKKYNEVNFRRIMFREIEREIEVINSSGIKSYDRQSEIVLFVQAVVSDPGRGMETGYEAVGGGKGLEIFDEFPPEKVATIAVERGLKALKSEWVEAGVMSVVISSDAGGTIIHEAVGHGLEGDLAYNNLSVYSDKIGEKVAGELVTIVDDATLAGYRGSFRYDDEGTSSKRTILIENGVLKGYMTDLFYSEKLGLEPTGNGRRESYRFMPIVRMTNTFMMPGKNKVSDIINAVDKGLYVMKMGGGEVNTVSGDFVFEVMEAHMIRNGEIAEPVRGATLIGNGPEVLKMVEMVGDDIGFSVGTCGKDGQGVPVTDGMPSVLISRLTVGGRVK